ncbi:hypothetical protein [Acetobacter pomorum]|uniref:hypothetical protein n=1 Tax=Acetobacter pomorum TaxID=65959 RepID=UPI00142DAEE5|nr:hypothetical protein [Acetobacter pomorum]
MAIRTSTSPILPYGYNLLYVQSSGELNCGINALCSQHTQCEKVNLDFCCLCKGIKNRTEPENGSFLLAQHTHLRSPNIRLAQAGLICHYRNGIDGHLNGVKSA